MKLVNITTSMISVYEGRNGKPLKCHRCKRKLKDGDKAEVTIHARRYYCLDCVAKMEIEVKT
jgi:hypothetical protein